MFYATIMRPGCTTHPGCYTSEEAPTKLPSSELCPMCEGAMNEMRAGDAPITRTGYISSNGTPFGVVIPASFLVLKCDPCNLVFCQEKSDA